MTADGVGVVVDTKVDVDFGGTSEGGAELEGGGGADEGGAEVDITVGADVDSTVEDTGGGEKVEGGTEDGCWVCYKDISAMNKGAIENLILLSNKSGRLTTCVLTTTFVCVCTTVCGGAVLTCTLVCCCKLLKGLVLLGEALLAPAVPEGVPS